MSAELTALEDLASNFTTAWFRLSAISQAVLFYATPYLTARFNWIDRTNPTDEITDADWDTIQAYVDGLLYEAKNPMIGYIISYITTDPPAGVLPCDGSTYLREDFPALYAALDDIWIISDDEFVTPDLRGRTIIGGGHGDTLSDHPVGENGGTEMAALDISQIPSHHHTIPLTATTLAVEPGEVTVLTPVPFFTQNTGDTGGNELHYNMQPYLALSYGVIAS